MQIDVSQEMLDRAEHNILMRSPAALAMIAALSESVDITQGYAIVQHWEHNNLELTYHVLSDVVLQHELSFACGRKVLPYTFELDLTQGLSRSQWSCLQSNKRMIESWADKPIFP